MKKLNKLNQIANENGIVIPVILWWLGLPITLIIILWLIF